jgi:hypothetical protein
LSYIDPGQIDSHAQPNRDRGKEEKLFCEVLRKKNFGGASPKTYVCHFRITISNSGTARKALQVDSVSVDQEV